MMDVVNEIMWSLALVTITAIDIERAIIAFKEGRYLTCGLFISVCIWLWSSNISIFLS